MPILKYFLYVSAALLALLFVVDAGLPPAQLRNETVHHPDIRIASSVPAPAAISFSGQTVDYGIKQDLQVVDLSARAGDTRTQAFAQASEGLPAMKSQPAAKPAPQRSRKRYVRRPVPPAPEPADIWSWPRFDVVSGARF